MDAVALKSKMNTILPDVDFEKGLRLSVNSMENYKKALYCALKSIRFKLPLLDSMITTDEYDGLRVITRTLGQLLTNIGADKLAERGYSLEYIVLNEEISVLQDETIQYYNELAYFMETLEEAFPARSKKIG